MPPKSFKIAFDSPLNSTAPLPPDYFRVTDQMLASNPYTSIVLLEQYRNGYPILYSTGTIVVLSISGVTKVFVLTCAHTIQHPTYGFADRIRVYRACNSPLPQGGYIDVLPQNMRVSSAWGQAHSQYRSEDDYGILMNTSFPGPIRLPLSLAFCTPESIKSWVNQAFVQGGYPVNPPYAPIGQMWTQAGTIDSVYRDDLLYYNLGHDKGNSGAGIVVYDAETPHVMGILIGNDTQSGGTVFLPLISPIYYAIQSWLTAPASGIHFLKSKL